MTLQEIKKLNRDWEEAFGKELKEPDITSSDRNSPNMWIFEGYVAAKKEAKLFIKNHLSLCETRLLEGVVEMIEERLEFGVENKQMFDLKQSLTKEIK